VCGTHVVEASRNPGLAAIAHKRIEVALAAALATHPPDEERGRLYNDFIVCSLSERDRSIFEDQMARHYEYQSDFACKYIIEGEARGEAKAILAVLQARGIDVASCNAPTSNNSTDGLPMLLMCPRVQSFLRNNHIQIIRRFSPT
jgi:hypothetical protein